jgi:hypothetical protein
LWLGYAQIPHLTNSGKEIMGNAIMFLEFKVKLSNVDCEFWNSLNKKKKKFGGI